MQSKRIVLTTYGSFGDLHPYIALALELRARGHRPVIVTSEIYRGKIEPLGIDFHPARPDFPGPDQLDAVAELIERTMDSKTGPEFVIKDMFVQHVRASYEDLSEAVRGADLLLTHPITFAGPVVAEKTRIPWVSSVLAPGSFISVYDLPVPPQAPGLARLLSRLPASINRVIIGIIRRRLAKWFEPVARLRAELGLPPGQHPLFEGQHSPALVLALFSKVLAEPQPDWPPKTHITGFCFYDRRDEIADEPGLPLKLQKFLEAGPPPIVFTLGSAAVWAAGDFYRESIEAARRLGQRAILLIGGARNMPDGELPEDIMAVEYAPYGELLPHASVVVHQGGIGTTAQALRAGRPMLVVPYTHDQPDNGARASRLGVGRMLLRKNYTAARAAQELSALLNDPSYARRADRVGRRVRSEDGTSNACNLIEEMLSRQTVAQAEREELIHASSH